MAEPADFTYTLRDLRVVFADGAVARLGEVVSATLGSSRMLLVSTPGRASVTEKVRAILGSRIAATFDGARLHVPTAVVAEALDVTHATDPDCVVAIGGGSAIGLGKALVRQTALPLVAVPTTYSGSEMTDIWGVMDGGRKETGRDSRVAPRVVVYDPELTYTMPPHVTGPSGMNAIAHSVEALYSAARNPVTCLLAADGIRRLTASLPVLAGDPGKPRARRQALLGAHLCGRALHMTSMGLHHKLCHILGGTLGLPHALTHAVVLPHTTAYNASAAPDAMETIASSLGVSDAVQGLWQLNQTLGITQTLADLGLHKSDLNQVIEQVTSQSYPNPTPVTAHGVQKILLRAIAGDPPE